MKVTPNPSLEGLNTLRLAASAHSLVEIENEEDVVLLPCFEPDRDLVLGGGSNVVFLSDVPGTVYLNRLPGIDVVEENEGRVIVEAGAGVGWHELVMWSVGRGLGGIENLALIPGSVGAAPIQNIGAYGVELESVLETVTAWDWLTCSWTTLSREDCRFGYRDSLFRTENPNRYLITSLRLSLSRRFDPILDYAGLGDELGDEAPTPRSVAEAVIRLRRRKLPDPGLVGNVGSFFKNPVVEKAVGEELLSRHAGMPSWPVENGKTKLSAGWMIEACGLKGVKQGGARVSEQHALVLVNEGGASGHDVSALSVQVRKAVFENFGIHLEPEPRLVDFSSDAS